MMTSTATQNEAASSILDHLACYRLTVPEALTTSPLLKSLGKRAVKQQLQMLLADERVGRSPLYGARLYYYLTSRQVATNTGRDRSRLGPLSELAKIRSFSMLAFCCLSGTIREKMTPAELADVLPELPGGGNRDNYYIETTASENRIGHALIDCGTHGRWDRVMQKLREDVRYHLRHNSVRALCQERQFEWAVLTTLPQKVARLREAMNQMSELRGVQVRICANPELIHLIAPPAG